MMRLNYIMDEEVFFGGWKRSGWYSEEENCGSEVIVVSLTKPQSSRPMCWN